MAKRARTARRARERALAKLGRDQERLFALGPGGAPDRPLDVASAHAVEPRARSEPCPRCSAEHAVLEHVAVTRGGDRLREVRAVCRGCGSRRSIWLRIAPRLPS